MRCEGGQRSVSRAGEFIKSVSFILCRLGVVDAVDDAEEVPAGDAGDEPHPKPDSCHRDEQLVELLLHRIAGVAEDLGPDWVRQEVPGDRLQRPSHAWLPYFRSAAAIHSRLDKNC